MRDEEYTPRREKGFIYPLTACLFSSRLCGVRRALADLKGQALMMVVITRIDAYIQGGLWAKTITITLVPCGSQESREHVAGIPYLLEHFGKSEEHF